MKIKRVLAIGAHPNDASVVCGGTLAKYAKNGAKVFICSVSDGSAWSEKIPPAELVRIRRKEAEASAKIIKAELIWTGAKDALLFTDKELIFKLIDVIREARPEVVITHNPEDYCDDKRVTSNASFNAALLSSLSNVKTKLPAVKETPSVYFMDTWIPRLFVPTEYVDITGTFEKKLAMVKAQKAPMELLKKHDKIDIVEFVKNIALRRGFQCGARYAECFKVCPNMPIIRTYRQLP
jgi:N-acetylglucosamine malate deacetylase 1